MKPVLIYKGADSVDFSDSCILGMTVLSIICSCYPYVFMRIGAQMGQLTEK